MWSGQNQWPNAPQRPSSDKGAGQVDWAALAQAWIQQKSSGDQSPASSKDTVQHGMANNAPQPAMMANNHPGQYQQWQQQGTPWQRAPTNQNQNWAPNMYQPPNWQRPPPPEQWSQSNTGTHQWQGHFNRPWFGGGPENGMQQMPQKITNPDPPVAEPPKRVEPVPPPRIQNGNNSSRLESIRPPPPLPDLPPPVRKDPGMDAARQEFEYGHGSVQPPGFAESGDFRDRNEFMQRQTQQPYFEEMPDQNQWAGDGPQQWEDGGGNWGGMRQPPWSHDDGEFVPPLMAQPAFDGNDEQAKMDALKQRKLPPWLREGLEKMEREKQKKLEEEEMKKNVDRPRGDEDEKSTHPLNSKFDSDAGESDSELPDANQSGSVKDAGSAPSDSESEDDTTEKTEEEKQMELMMRVRRMLTEVLLDVTNSEAENIAEEVYAKAKKKAQANAIAKPNSSTSQFGLIAGYGSESEAESNDGDEAEQDSDEGETDSKIETKRKEFNDRQREVLRVLEDMEEKRESAKKTNVEDSPKPTKIAESGSEDEKSSADETEDKAKSRSRSPVSKPVPQKPRSSSSSSSTSSNSSGPRTKAAKDKPAPKRSEAARKSRSASRDRKERKSRKKKASEHKRSRSRDRDRYRSKDRKRRSTSRERKGSRERKRRSVSRERRRSRPRGTNRRNPSKSPERQKRRRRSLSSGDSAGDAGKSSKAKSKSRGKKSKRRRRSSDSSSSERESKKTTGKKSRRKHSR